MKKQIVKKSVVVVILVIMLLALVVPGASASGGNYHRVRYGETLFSIGRYYGVDPYRISSVNNLANPNCIYAGQVLYIPEDDSYNNIGYDGCYNGCDNDRKDDHRPGGGHDGSHPGGNYHVVRYGETLTSIAYYYGVSPWAIANANGIYNLNHIYAGQRLRIPMSAGHYDN